LIFKKAVEYILKRDSELTLYHIKYQTVSMIFFVDFY